MTTQTAERQELQQAIDALPDDSIVIALDFVRELRGAQTNAETTDAGMRNELTGLPATRAAIAELRAGKGERVTIEQVMTELNAGN